MYVRGQLWWGVGIEKDPITVRDSVFFAFLFAQLTIKLIISGLFRVVLRYPS